MTSIDENTRRYYLDTMGIQCWTLAVEQSETPHDAPQESQSVTVGQCDKAVADWAQLQTTILQCEQCGLHKTRNLAIAKPMLGQACKTSSLMFAVLSPGEHGELLSEQAKALFEKMLAAIKLSIDEVSLTSLLKCQVPENHTISASEISTCNQHLQQQIQLLQPKWLIILGETAARCYLQKNLSLDDIREQCNKGNNAPPKSVNKTRLFVSYSPQELLQQPENKRKAWTDLQQLQENLAQISGD